jgi:acyl carrier protein
MEYEIIQKMIAEVLGLKTEDVTPESSFVDDLGADSMDRLRLVLRLEDEFRIEIGDRAEQEVETVADLLSLMRQMR